MQKTIQKNDFYSKVIYLEVGKSISLEELKNTFVQLGYERTDMVEGRGQFSIRGGIIDGVKSANIDVTIEKKEEIIIPAYEKTIAYQYANPVEKGEEK